MPARLGFVLRSAGAGVCGRGRRVLQVPLQHERWRASRRHVADDGGQGVLRPPAQRRGLGHGANPHRRAVRALRGVGRRRHPHRLPRVFFGAVRHLRDRRAPGRRRAGRAPRLRAVHRGHETGLHRRGSAGLRGHTPARPRAVGRAAGRVGRGGALVRELRFHHRRAGAPATRRTHPRYGGHGRHQTQHQAHARLQRRRHAQLGGRGARAQEGAQGARGHLRREAPRRQRLGRDGARGARRLRGRHALGRGPSGPPRGQRPAHPLRNRAGHRLARGAGHGGHRLLGRRQARDHLDCRQDCQ